MKTIVILLLLVTSRFVFSQTDSVVTIISERNITLNGGARSQVGGRSRTSIKIDLPENTTRWYYSFTTETEQTGTDNLNLSLQLASLLLTKTGSFESLIKVPAGSGSADILLLNDEGNSKFLTKDDNWGSVVKRYTEGSVYNTNQGVIEIDDVTSGTFYLGLKNPATWDQLKIWIEVVAIVDNSNENSWPIETVNALYDEVLEYIKSEDIEESVAETISSCVTKHITTEYSLQEVSEWNSAELASIEKRIFEECIGEDNQCANQQKADTYGNLGWTYFESGKIEESIKFSKKSLAECDNNMIWVKANLGLCYLVQDEIETSLEFYVDAIESSKKSNLGKQYIKSAIEDLEKFKQDYPIIKDHPEIMSLLKYELE